jgi:hypothetical protein
VNTARVHGETSDVFVHPNITFFSILYEHHELSHNGHGAIRVDWLTGQPRAKTRREAAYSDIITTYLCSEAVSDYSGRNIKQVEKAGRRDISTNANTVSRHHHPSQPSQSTNMSGQKKTAYLSTSDEQPNLYCTSGHTEKIQCGFRPRRSQQNAQQDLEVRLQCVTNPPSHNTAATTATLVPSGFLVFRLSQSSRKVVPVLN